MRVVIVRVPPTNSLAMWISILKVQLQSSQEVTAANLITVNYQTQHRKRTHIGDGAQMVYTTDGCSVPFRRDHPEREREVPLPLKAMEAFTTSPCGEHRSQCR